MKQLKILFLYVFFIIPLSAAACERTFSVASHDAFWPPYVVTVNGKLQGSEVEALNIIFEDSPFCFKVEMLPNSKRAFTEIRHGRIDLGWAGSYTKDRAQYVYFSDSYRDEVMRLYQNKNNPHNITNLADIFDQGLTIGANFGSYYGAEFERYKKTHPDQIEYTSATQKRFEMLVKQRLDFIIEDNLAGGFFVKSMPTIELLTAIPFINKNPVHLMLSKRNTREKDMLIINALIKSKKTQLDALFNN
ncbi:transporter substrate-binding domain-containing protein [Pseudoalteromonas sp. TB64]|uniref:substrate-binding periplasmic protein n=1 Tax=Pseudoalteromonas sp. TB64 TaxID=1938600 RepID=UPI00042362EB|nr:transporter substrate-binding domain-containing protein [Pseudoalteromonas sp. TB64]